MEEKSALIARLERELARLRDRTGACRTTLRFESAELGFRVDDVCAESVREGLNSLKGETSIDQRRGVAFQWLDRHRRVFVERDCLNAAPEVAPEREVIEIYGVRAEMVAPLIEAGRLAGAVSVHYTRGARDWTALEIATVESACKEILGILDEARSRKR